MDHAFLQFFVDDHLLFFRNIFLTLYLTLRD